MLKTHPGLSYSFNLNKIRRLPSGPTSLTPYRNALFLLIINHAMPPKATTCHQADLRSYLAFSQTKRSSDEIRGAPPGLSLRMGNGRPRWYRFAVFTETPKNVAICFQPIRMVVISTLAL